MSTNTKIALAFTAALVVGGVALTALLISQQPKPAPAPEAGAPLPTTLASDTHVLDQGATDVTLVEFLDFECEACGAYFPYVEELRKQYAGEVTFAFRYFPLPGHGNSVNAAVAVEAAARQDALEPMFTKMFETQGEWGERGSESQAHVFRGYAEALGLDLAKFDADVADPEVLARVQSDFDAGITLGVSGTPTFFVNDRKVELNSPTDLIVAIEAELEK